MYRLAIGLAVLLLMVPTLHAQTTQPAGARTLEVRAMAAFNKGDYATALPLLVKLSQQMVAQPQRLAAVQEKIRVCQRNLGPRAAELIKAAAPIDGGAAIKMSPEERKAHAKPKDGQILELAIRQLGNFEYDAEHGGNIPQDVKDLSGVKIRTYGYMIPLDQADNVTQFVLVPSLFECCFGQPPQVQHTMVVKTPKGKAVGYTSDEIVVEGVLRVEEKQEDGIITGVFEIDCTSVKTR